MSKLNFDGCLYRESSPFGKNIAWHCLRWCSWYLSVDTVITVSHDIFKHRGYDKSELGKGPEAESEVEVAATPFAQ